MSLLKKIKKLPYNYLINFLKKQGYTHQDYFTGLDKIYLASADNYTGVEDIVESDEFLQCKHFYGVIGGLGCLHIIARFKRLNSITFFDCNPFSLEVCEFIIEVIRKAENRDTFISLIYGRPFDSRRYSFHNQDSYYSLPIDPKWTEKLKLAVGPRLFEFYICVYWPYIQNPMKDLYYGASVHCTRLYVFHEPPIDGIMTHPFIDRYNLQSNHITNINSFFFGKGWLADEFRYQRIRQHLMNCTITMLRKSIFELSVLPSSGLYASNILEGTEKKFYRLVNKFLFTLWYSRSSSYLRLEYTFPRGERIIPFQKLYGKNVRNPHQSCCELLNDKFDLNTHAFLEVIQPHPIEGMNYGFRFYSGQNPISVKDFIDKNISKNDLLDIIGIHILMGGKCPVDIWKQVVRKAISFGKILFIFEHRKACNDWPEPDVDPTTILPEKEIDKFLLSLDARWRKYGAANHRGNVKDVRNICWILDPSSK